MSGPVYPDPVVPEKRGTLPPAPIDRRPMPIRVEVTRTGERWDRWKATTHWGVFKSSHYGWSRRLLERSAMREVRRIERGQGKHAPPEVIYEDRGTL